MLGHEHLVAPTLEGAATLAGSYSLWLVALSVSLAIAASFGALALAASLETMKDARSRRRWLLLGALAMGGGIWTMHFIGMMAFRLPVTVGYDVIWTAVSLLPAIAASLIALWVISRQKLDTPRLLAGGVLMGAGIGLMHYVGMGAMRGDFVMTHDPRRIAMSVAMAVGLAILALMVRQVIARWDDRTIRLWAQIAGALVMGGSVAGMHYAAMAATTFWQNKATVINGVSGLVLEDPGVLGGIVGIAAVLVTTMAMTCAAGEWHWRNAARLVEEIEVRSSAETRLREKNSALERSMADLEAFAYIASHDLREPLRTINCNLILLERQLDDRLSPTERDHLRVAGEGAKRLDRMILDLLQYSEIGRDGNGAEFVDTAAAIHSAIERQKKLITETATRIDMADGLPIIPGRKRDITRLFEQLINNAITYSVPRRPSHIRIRVTRDGADWLFHVSDNGIGISNQYDFHQRIFRLFHRLHGRSEFGGGSGVGLAICKKITDIHGGDITVESRGSGMGSTFIVRLPAESQTIVRQI